MPKSHEFIVTRDLYNEFEVEVDGQIGIEVRLVKKDLRTKWFCKDVAMIASCEQAYNDAGNIRREYCKILVDGDGEKIIRMKYKEAKELIQHNKYSKVGYRN